MKLSDLAKLLLTLTAVLLTCACSTGGSGGDQSDSDPDNGSDTVNGSDSDDDSGGDTDPDSASQPDSVSGLDSDSASVPDSTSASDPDSASDSASQHDSASTSDSSSDSPTDSEPTTDTNPLDCVAQHGAGWAYNPALYRCVNCSGKVCPAESSEGIYERTSNSGQCLCETKPGYFYSNTVANVLACDEDNDGWTIITAREFMLSKDQALKANARCDVRLVEQIQFVNEYGENEAVVPSLGDPPLTENQLPLYEAADRDSQDILDQDSSGNPVYGASGRRLRAEELNGFTKACITAINDANSNGVADVSEWPKASGLSGLDALYAPYAYFLELHHGYFEEADNSYHIVEKARVLDVGDSASLGVPFAYSGALYGPYWQTCERLTDSAYDSAADATGLGLDFSQFDHMTHASQFKCLQVVNPADLDPLMPQRVTTSSFPSEYLLNECSVEDEDPAPSPEGNPVPPLLTCTGDDDLPTVGQVGFALVQYIPHLTLDEYTRGCVSECLSPGWDVELHCGASNVAACVQNRGDFGAGMCGCDETYGHYTLESNCTVCEWDPVKGFWNIGQDDVSCDTCDYNYDLASGCTECVSDPVIGFYAKDENANPDETRCTLCQENRTAGSWCMDCAGGWVESSSDTDTSYERDCLKCPTLAEADADTDLGHWVQTGDNTCLQCTTNWDLSTGCTQCYDDHVNGHWADDPVVSGLDCSRCQNSTSDGHWGGASCSTCLDSDEDGHWAFPSCNVCKQLFFGADCRSCDGISRKIYSQQGNNCQTTVNLVDNPSANDPDNTVATVWKRYGDYSLNVWDPTTHGDTVNTPACPTCGKYFSFWCAWWSHACPATTARAYQEIKLDLQVVTDLQALKLYTFNASAYLAGYQDANERVVAKFYLVRDPERKTCADWGYSDNECWLKRDPASGDPLAVQQSKLLCQLTRPGNQTGGGSGISFTWDVLSTCTKVVHQAGLTLDDKVTSVFVVLEYNQIGGGAEAFYDEISATFTL